MQQRRHGREVHNLCPKKLVRAAKKTVQTVQNLMTAGQEALKETMIRVNDQATTNINGAYLQIEKTINGIDKLECRLHQRLKQTGSI